MLQIWPKFQKFSNLDPKFWKKSKCWKYIIFFLNYKYARINSTKLWWSYLELKSIEKSWGRQKKALAGKTYMNSRSLQFFGGSGIGDWGSGMGDWGSVNFFCAKKWQKMLVYGERSVAPKLYWGSGIGDRGSRISLRNFFPARKNAIFSFSQDWTFVLRALTENKYLLLDYKKHNKF